MLMSVLLFAVGLVLLIKGGDWFVDGATGIAKRFNLPDIVVGATVVSIGTVCCGSGDFLCTSTQACRIIPGITMPSQIAARMSFHNGLISVFIGIPSQEILPWTRCKNLSY